MKRILIIDDDKDIRKLYAEYLRKDYDTLTAESGNKGLALLKTETVDVVLCDIRMPDGDGFVFFNGIKQQPNRPLVFFISGEISLKEINHGADGFFAKPPDFDHVIAILKRSIG